MISTINIKQRILDKYQIIAMTTVTIPKGSILFHGSVEEFSGNLKPGGDGLIWFSDSPKIAQLYIPMSGMTLYATPNNLIKPSQDKQVQMLQKFVGIEYDMDKVKWEGHRLKSWPDPIGWDHYPKEIEIDNILKKDFDTTDSGSYIVKIHKNKIMKANEKAMGRLFIAKAKDNLTIWKKAHGEGDLMNLQYHDLSGFKNAKEKGLDGVLINDFAQSKEYGNFEHLSVGLYNTDKLDVKAIPAEYREWDYKAKGTPEYPNEPKTFLNDL